MKLYYHQTDGGAEYYCLQNITQTGRNPFPDRPSEEGDTNTWILRTDGDEFEMNTRRLADAGITVLIKS